MEEQPDPFGEDTAPDEAQTEMDWSGTFDTETNEDKKVVAVSSEGKVVVTLKGGRDFDEPWVVLHCDDLDDAVAQTTDYEKLGVLMDAAQKASKRFRELRPTEDKGTAQNTSQNRSQPRTEGRPAAATQGPWGEQSCKHGVMTFKSGQGDDGSFWQGYFCPAPRGATDKCKNKYVK